MTMTAAAPSLSVAGRDGAVGTERRAERRELLEGGAGTDAVVLVDDGAVGKRDRGDLLLPEATLERGGCPGLGQQRELVLLLAGDLLVAGDVLGGLAHGDVHVGKPGRRGPRRLATLVAQRGALLGLGELLVVRPAVGHAVHVAADGLDARRDEDVSLTCADGVGGHAGGLER